MRAAVYHGPGDVRIERRPRPRAGPGELLLDVSYAALCGTDSGEYAHGPILIPMGAPHPHSGQAAPLVLGHEFTGRVAEVGEGARGFAVGDRVVCGAGVWCGECSWCKEGRTNLCARYFTLGLHADGGLAEAVAVPAFACFGVPDACSDEAAAMAQPLAVALHVLERTGVSPGQSLAVIGVGGVGGFVIAAAADRGIAPLIALDIDEQRLRAAAELGATHTISTEDDPARAVREASGEEGTHAVVESSGAAAAPQWALDSVRRGGVIVAVGLAGRPVALNLTDLTLREVDLRGTLAHVCARDLPAALDLLARSDLAQRVAGPTLTLDSVVDDGLRALAERRATGKVLVDLSGQPT
jgi:(R,R)-butanediol dehydrogenase / meso-butanediol dehydrogenase / diacetyl reductase